MKKKIKAKEYSKWDKNIAKSSKLNHNKINRKIFQIRLQHNLKKCSFAEINLTIACCTAELQRRQKGNKK